MNAEVITVSTSLLNEETPDLLGNHIMQLLREYDFVAASRMLIAEENAERLADIIRDACRRSELVVVIGVVAPLEGNIVPATAKATGRTLHSELPGIAGAQLLAVEQSNRFGIFLEHDEANLFCLPNDRATLGRLAHERIKPLLEKEAKLARAVAYCTIRTIESYEYRLKEKLSSVRRLDQAKVSYVSFAGLTDMHVQLEDVDDDRVRQRMNQLVTDIKAQLGPIVYATDKQTPLHEVVYNELVAQGKTLLVLDGTSNKQLRYFWQQQLQDRNYVMGLTTSQCEDVHKDIYRTAEASGQDIRTVMKRAAQELRVKYKQDMALLLLVDKTPGVDIYATLATSRGESVTPLSFSGDPRSSVDYWAVHAGLTLLWLDQNSQPAAPA